MKHFTKLQGMDRVLIISQFILTKMCRELWSYGSYYLEMLHISDGGAQLCCLSFLCCVSQQQASGQVCDHHTDRPPP